MNKYSIRVKATIEKDVVVSAKNEEDAIEAAHEQFSPVHDGSEKYNEETVETKLLRKEESDPFLAPCVELDTYEASLHNESPPRRESVSEIQSTLDGELLCYANPARVGYIKKCVDHHKDLMEKLRESRQLLSKEIAKSKVNKGCIDASFFTLFKDLDSLIIKIEDKQ